MDGSPSAIITLGLGSWSEAGLILTLGYGIGAEVEPLQITEIVGGWYIPGATIGEVFAAGPAINPNSVVAAQGFAAGSQVAEGRFQ